MSRLIPRGAVVAGLGKRFLAAVIDALPLLLIVGLRWLVLRGSGQPTVLLVTGIAAAVLSLAYALYQWWGYASRGAGLGAQVTGLRLVSIRDGEPIGWWRVFLRHLIFTVLLATVVGGIALLVFLVIHERRQGWHDMAADSVVVEPKESGARVPGPAAKRAPQASTVGLPPHLASTFSPQAGTSTANWDSFAPTSQPPSGRPPRHPLSTPPAPDWLPGVQSEPVRPVPQAPFNAGAQWQPQQPTPVPPLAPEEPTQFSPPASAPSAPPPEPVPPTPQETPSRPIPQWIPLPTPTSVIEPSVKVRPRSFGEVEDEDGTRIAHVPANAGRGGGEGWYARLDDGREVELNVTVLLGRNPQKGPEDPEVHLVPASGDGRMISRTHLLIGTDPRGVYVVDRGSTNGTALVTTAGQLEPCPEGVQMRVREGQQVSYGNRWFTVLRRPIAG